MDNRYYGFDMFDRGRIGDNEVLTLCCEDNSVAVHALAQGTSSSTYGLAERGISTIATNSIATVDKVDACENSISVLKSDMSALTTSINDTARALKELTERVNRIDGAWGNRLRRSDLRTLRVG